MGESLFLLIAAILDSVIIHVSIPRGKLISNITSNGQIQLSVKWKTDKLQNDF